MDSYEFDCQELAYLRSQACCHVLRRFQLILASRIQSSACAGRFLHEYQPGIATLIRNVLKIAAT